MSSNSVTIIKAIKLAFEDESNPDSKITMNEMRDLKASLSPEAWRAFGQECADHVGVTLASK